MPGNEFATDFKPEDIDELGIEDFPLELLQNPQVEQNVPRNQPGPLEVAIPEKPPVPCDPQPELNPRQRQTQQDRLLEEAREITGQLPAKQTRIQRRLLRLALGDYDPTFVGEEEFDD